MNEPIEQLDDYDELVDQSARYIFDGLLVGGSRELRNRLWALLHPVWREELARREAKQKKKGKK